MRSVATGVLLGLLLGCASNLADEPVPGWPSLQVFEHHVAHAEMRDQCSRWTHAVATPMACALINLKAGRCDIYYSADFPPPAYVVEEERKHCKGYDHAGEETMAAMLRRHEQEFR